MEWQEDHRRVGCEGKTRYAGIAEARAAIRRLRRSRKSKAVDHDITAYTCRYCGGAHFGHTPFHVKQGRRDRRRAKGGDDE